MQLLRLHDLDRLVLPSLRLLLLVLPQLRVDPALRQQAVVVAVLRHPTLVHHDDLVRLHQRREPVPTTAPALNSLQDSWRHEPNPKMTVRH